MAKSEYATATANRDDAEADVYDIEALLSEDLTALADEVEISGIWKFQYRGGQPVTGVSDKGPWAMLNLFFQPIAPVNESDITDAEIAELSSIRHRMFFTKQRDKRQFVELVAKMGVSESNLRDMLNDAKGEYILAKVAMGKDNRGEKEYKLSGFRAVADENLEEAA